MRVLIHKKALADMKRIPEQMKAQIKATIKTLENYPAVRNVRKILGATTVIDGEKYTPLRLRVGKYRVIFVVVNDTIIIVRVLPRSVAYKR